jgi:hypothetical protein
MAKRTGKARVRRVPLSEVKDDLSKYLHLAGSEEIVIKLAAQAVARDRRCKLSKPRAQNRSENDPRFLERVEKARASLKAGRGVRLEDVQR